MVYWPVIDRQQLPIKIPRMYPNEIYILKTCLLHKICKYSYFYASRSGMISCFL